MGATGGGVGLAELNCVFRSLCPQTQISLKGKNCPTEQGHILPIRLKHLPSGLMRFCPLGVSLYRSFGQKWHGRRWMENTQIKSEKSKI